MALRAVLETRLQNPLATHHNLMTRKEQLACQGLEDRNIKERPPRRIRTTFLLSKIVAPPLIETSP